MKWDKGNTPIMARIVPRTTIRIRPPWQKTGSQRLSALARPGGPKLRVVETPVETPMEASKEAPKPSDGEDKA